MQVTPNLPAHTKQEFLQNDTATNAIFNNVHFSKSTSSTSGSLSTTLSCTTSSLTSSSSIVFVDESSANYIKTQSVITGERSEEVTNSASLQIISANSLKHGLFPFNEVKQEPCELESAVKENVEIKNEIKDEIKEIDDETGNEIKAEIQDEEKHVEEEDEIDIIVSNIVTNFETKCYLNLKNLASKGVNTIFKREKSMVQMKTKNPELSAHIWSSGKVVVFGASTMDSAKLGSRKIARKIQKIFPRTKFKGFRIVNVFATCRMPFGINLNNLATAYSQCSYEPELNSGANFVYRDLKVNIKIFQTGSMTITGPSIEAVQQAVHRVYPLVHQHQKPKH